MSNNTNDSSGQTTSGQGPRVGSGGTEAEEEGSELSELIISYGNRLYDTVCAIIWCPTHKRMALRRLNETKGLWLPTAPIRRKKGWYECATRLTEDILQLPENKSDGRTPLRSSSPKLINVMRIQIPIYCEFISRIIFFTEISSKKENKCCAETEEGIQWFGTDSLIGNRIQELWGPEPALFAEAIVRKAEIPAFVEFTIRDILKFYPRDSHKSLQQEMVKGCGVSEKDMFDIYGEYIQHMYPSQYMTFYSFEDYMTRAGFPQLSPGLQLNLKSIFRAFSFNSFEYLSFYELLLGMCAMDRHTPHKNMRSVYLFRYYSGKHSSGVYLNVNDVKALVRDINRVRSTETIDESLVDKEVQKILIAANSQDSHRLEENTFHKLIGDGKLRNTSSLFRSETDVVQQIRTKRVYDYIQLTQIEFSTAVGAKLQRIRGTCKRCKQKKYTLAAHNVHLSREGYIVDPHDNIGQSDVQQMEISLRRKSNTCFKSSTPANFFLDKIRDFANQGEASNWHQNKQELVEKIKNLLTECREILRRESRVLRVSSPVFVLGDIHGNLHDLMIYETALWKMGPTCVAADFLFLGDYVDRGENSVECILYLLSLKVLCPQKYWLLRGNHELRSVQQTFTFKTECVEKFGDTEGLQLWEAFNKVFDHMPVCALIDESIFCAHGGIPTSCLKIDELYKMPVPMTDPKSEFPSAWEILWNDPITNQEFLQYEQMLKENVGSIQRAGFVPNSKRGTAFYFSGEALNRFLSANQLSHVIRAHEVIPNGFAYHMGGKCTTIFSSSKYCGGLNEAAVILVNDEKIRIVKIDTNY